MHEGEKSRGRVWYKIVIMYLGALQMIKLNLFSVFSLAINFGTLIKHEITIEEEHKYCV